MSTSLVSPLHQRGARKHREPASFTVINSNKHEATSSTASSYSQNTGTVFRCDNLYTFTTLSPSIRDRHLQLNNSRPTAIQHKKTPGTPQTPVLLYKSCGPIEAMIAATSTAASAQPCNIFCGDAMTIIAAFMKSVCG